MLPPSLIAIITVVISITTIISHLSHLHRLSGSIAFDFKPISVLFTKFGITRDFSPVWAFKSNT